MMLGIYQQSLIDKKNAEMAEMGEDLSGVPAPCDAVPPAHEGGLPEAAMPEYHHQEAPAEMPTSDLPPPAGE